MPTLFTDKGSVALPSFECQREFSGFPCRWRAFLSIMLDVLRECND